MLPISMSGTIHNMIKTQQLQMKWQMRKADPKLLKEGSPEEREIARFQEDAARMRESSVISNLDGKLQSGQKLSYEEMEYLRINNPDLYKKAVEASMEREQYKKALENCRTKEDVERLNANKMQGFLSETTVIRSNPNIPQGKKLELLKQITRRMMGVQSEHLIFTSKPQYAVLPREAELEEGKKKKKEKPETVPELDIKPDMPQPVQKAEKGEPVDSKELSGDESVTMDTPDTPDTPDILERPYKADTTTASPKGKYAAAVAKSLPEGIGVGAPGKPVASALVKTSVSISKRA